jgi:hypothetical protein
MAETVNEMPSIGRHKKNKYPWHDWFDGQVWKIEESDFEPTSIAGFRSGATIAAKRMGLTVITRVDKDNGFVYLQAVDGDEEEGSDG